MRTATLDDWHPPVMARVWQGAGALGLDGTGPLFALQVGLFCAGLGLVFGALPRLRPVVVAVAVAALVIPADWISVVVKDAQMVASLTCATGIVAAFRLRGRVVPGWAIGAVAVLLGYALLLRANAVFGVAPLALAWANWGGVRSLAARAALLLAATLAVIAVSPVVNHRLLGASASHVERVLPVFDLAGIAHFGGPAPPRVDRVRWAAGDCYRAALWDPLGDATRCGFVADRLGLGSDAGANLMREWAAAIVAHPLAYARHRLAHLNDTLRFVVPAGQPNAGAPPDSQPNLHGLGGGGTWRTRAPAWVARTLAATPLGWPVVWLAASVGVWASAVGAPRAPPRDLALALALSAACMTLSFAVVSIASDLRYHLWAIVATTLAGVVLSTAAGVPRRRLAAAAGAVALVAAIGTVARLTLPPGIWT